MRRATKSGSNKKTAKRVFDCYELNKAAHQAYLKKEYQAAADLLLDWKKEFAALGTKDENAAYAFWMIGISLYMCKRFAQSERYLLRSAVIYKNIDNTAYSSSMWWYATSLQERKLFKKAARGFETACEWAIEKKLEPSGLPSRSYAQIGFCLWRAKNYDGALTAFRNCIGWSKNESVVLVANLMQKLLQIYSELPKSNTRRAGLRKLIDRATNIAEAKLRELSAPETQTESVHERKFGHVIADPFRWLEDTQSEQVGKWIAAQKQFSEVYLDSIPGRSELLKRIHKMFSVKPVKVTYKIGSYYFTADKPLTKLYRSDKAGKIGELVLSSSDLPKNCTLSHITVSRNGKYVAYWVTSKGSDWQSIYVKNVSTGTRVTGVLKQLRAKSLIWDKTNGGFYYAAFPRGSDHCEIRYHRLRSKQADDKLLCRIDEPDVYASISMVSDKYLMVTTYGTRRQRHSIFLINVKSSRHKTFTVLDEQPNSYYFIGQNNDRIFFITDKNAPMFRIVSLSIGEVESMAKLNGRAKFRETIAEQSSSLKRAFNWGEFLVCIYATKSGEVIRRWNTLAKSELEPISLPTGTSARNIYYMEYPVIRLLVEGYTVPSTIYELNFKTGKMTAKSPYKTMIDTKQFVTEKLYARSRDGSRIPFYVRYRKGMKMDGNNPTLMTGYGGFDRDIDPACDNYDLVWMDLGGVCVETVLRGDAGLGADWRNGGRRENKQRTFDDFIAVAKKLIREKYTKPEKLGVSGFSNGGLLMGAALTQRPDLFGAVEVGCGLLDMLRFHKFGTEKHWELEYGIASTKKFFEILHAYSPLHNVRKRKYPAVLITTGSHDDRVSPAHSYKFAATLQANQTGDAPVLLSVEMDAGHGFKPQSNLGLNRLSFFGYQLGVIPDALLVQSAPPKRYAALRKS